MGLRDGGSSVKRVRCDCWGSEGSEEERVQGGF